MNLPPEDERGNVLATDDDLQQRVIQMTTPIADRRTAWAILLHEGVQVPVFVPIPEIVGRPEDSQWPVLSMVFKQIMSSTTADALVLVWERFSGTMEFTADDKAWANAVRAAAHDNELNLRAQFLTSPQGTRIFTLDDLL